MKKLIPELGEGARWSGIAQRLGVPETVRGEALSLEQWIELARELARRGAMPEALVAVEGWLEASEISALELAQRYEDAGVAALIHTDIARDGALSGPNIEASAQLADAVSIPLIVSGGVARLDDLLAAKAQAHRGFDGIISGRALYDGRLDPKQALEALAA